MRIRSERRRFLLGVIGVLLVLNVAALLLGLFVARNISASASWMEDGEPPGWVAVAGIVMAVLGLLVWIGGIVRAVRSGRFRAGRESRLWAVSWRRRQELARQVRRAVVDTADDLPLLRHAAVQMVNQRWIVLIFAGLAMLQVGQALFHYSMFWLVIGILTTTMFALAAWQLLRDARRAEAFLHAHPEAAVTPGGGGANGSGPRRRGER